MQKREVYWLAGLLEGEGCFQPQTTTPCSITLEMKDEDVVKRVAGFFNVSYHKVKRKNPNWSDTYKCMLRGKPAVDMMRKIYPIMSKRRQLKMKECISSYINKTLNPYKKDIKGFKGKLSVDDTAKKFNLSKWRVYQIWRE